MFVIVFAFQNQSWTLGFARLLGMSSCIVFLHLG